MDDVRPGSVEDYERRALKARRETIATAILGDVVRLVSTMPLSQILEVERKGVAARVTVEMADALIAELDK